MVLFLPQLIDEEHGPWPLLYIHSHRFYCFTTWPSFCKNIQVIENDPHCSATIWFEYQLITKGLLIHGEFSFLNTANCQFLKNLQCLCILSDQVCTNISLWYLDQILLFFFFFPKQIYKNRKCTVRGPISQQGTWMWRLSGTAKHFKYAILGKLLKFFQLWFYHLKIGDNNST